MPDLTQLRDGRQMEVRLASSGDTSAIAEAHPLPRDSSIPDKPLRTYYAFKAWLHATTPGAGVMTGWVGGELAGFIFFSVDESCVGRAMRSLRSLRWLCGQFLRGRLSWSPRVWVRYIAWVRQHFRQPAQGADGREAPTVPTFRSWIGTVHTVDAFRRLGVASALLSEAEQVLAGLGANQAALWAATENEAGLRLYEQRGYSRVAIVPRIGEQCWLMNKDLPNRAGPPLQEGPSAPTPS